MAEPLPRAHPHNLKIQWTLTIVKYPSRRGGKGGKKKTSRKEKKNQNYSTISFPVLL